MGESNAEIMEQMRAEGVEKEPTDGMGEASSGRPAGWGEQMATFQGVPAFNNGADRRYWQRGEFGYNYQCVEYVNRFSAKANGTGNMKGTGNAIDYAGNSRKSFGYTWVKNEPGAQLPEPGDILVFSGGKFGHVAIATRSSPGGVGMIQQNTSAATATLGISGKDGNTTVANYGSLKLEGWQRFGGTKPKSPTQKPSQDVEKGPGGPTVTVKPGDSLWAIAARTLGSGERYRELAKLNGISDPSRISVGMVLRLPGTTAPAKPSTGNSDSAPKKPAQGGDIKERTVTVQRGDTLWAIAVRYLGNGSRHQEIARLNGIRDARSLSVGTKLKLPG